MFCDLAYSAYKYGGKMAHANGSRSFLWKARGFLCRIKNESMQSAEWVAHFSACKEGENGLLIILGACLYQSRNSVSVWACCRGNSQYWDSGCLCRCLCFCKHIHAWYVCCFEPGSFEVFCFFFKWVITIFLGKVMEKLKESGGTIWKHLDTKVRYGQRLQRGLEKRK